MTEQPSRRTTASEAFPCIASLNWAKAASNSPDRYSAAPSAVLASAYQGDAGSVPDSAAAAADSRITRIPSNPNTPRRSAAENASDGIPSGSGPSSSPASTTASQRRTESCSPESAAHHAAQCAATGLMRMRSSPIESSQARSVGIRLVSMQPGQLRATTSMAAATSSPARA